MFIFVSAILPVLLKTLNIMDLKIADLRILLKSFFFDFDLFLSDSEVNSFSDLDRESLFLDGVKIDQSLVDQQDSLYMKLELYVRLLQELLKCRPLPF